MDAPSGFEAEEFYGETSGSEGEGASGSGGPGMGQSKSSRRRRRKRKGKAGSPEAAVPDAEANPASAAPTIIMEGESLALAAGASQPSPRKQGNGGGSQPQGSNGQGSNSPGSNGQAQANAGQPQANGSGQAAGSKRWKKKFRDRERRPQRNENPGNDFRAEGSSNGGGSNGYRPEYRSDGFGNGSGGFKRKGKGGGQAKDRGFVGPMDHSYREGNGSDGPPATIQVHGSHSGRRSGHRHHGDNQPIDHNMPRPVPIPEGAQTHMYFFIEELFFVAKIQEAARKQGVKVAFVKNDKEVLAELTGGEENRPALIVFDLNNANAKPLTLIPKLKTKLKRSVSIVGFLSHLQGDLKAKAVEAGCDVVMPRAAFSQNLPNLLRRYGVEEENEVNFNR